MKGHSAIVGMTGSGKTFLAKKIARLCLQNRFDVIFSDPHGGELEERGVKEFTALDDVLDYLDGKTNIIWIADETPYYFTRESVKAGYKDEILQLVQMGRHSRIFGVFIAQYYNSLPSALRTNLLDIRILNFSYREKMAIIDEFCLSKNDEKKLDFFLDLVRKNQTGAYYLKLSRLGERIKIVKNT